MYKFILLFAFSGFAFTASMDNTVQPSEKIEIDNDKFYISENLCDDDNLERRRRAKGDRRRRRGGSGLR